MLSEYRKKRDALKVSRNSSEGITWQFYQTFSDCLGSDASGEPEVKVSIGGENPQIILNDEAAVRVKDKHRKEVASSMKRNLTSDLKEAKLSDFKIYVEKNKERKDKIDSRFESYEKRLDKVSDMVKIIYEKMMRKG